MNLLVIVTTPAYDLLEWTADWDVDDVLKEVTVRAKVVRRDKIVILCQAESRLEDRSEREREITEKTTQWVTRIANSPEHGADAKVYIAAHSDYVDLRFVRWEVDKEKIGAIASFNHLPESPGLDELSDALYKLIPEPDHETFNATLDAIKNRQVKTHTQRLSALKHSLAHLFLPISVDLQAWRGFDFDDEYMKEIINSYQADEGRLKRARELLYGAVKSPEADSMEKIVREAGLEESQLWSKVISLLPRREPKSEEEKRDSSVYIEVFQTQDVLGSLKSSAKLNELKDLLKTDNPFNRWYVELDEALIELRKEMDRHRSDVEAISPQIER